MATTNPMFTKQGDTWTINFRGTNSEDETPTDNVVVTIKTGVQLTYHRNTDTIDVLNADDVVNVMFDYRDGETAWQRDDDGRCPGVTGIKVANLLLIGNNHASGWEFELKNGICVEKPLANLSDSDDDVGNNNSKDTAYGSVR